jgi:restriction system protein
LGKEGVIPANAEDDTDEAQDFAPDIEDIANQQIVSLIKSEFAGTALGGPSCCNALAWP